MKPRLFKVLVAIMATFLVSGHSDPGAFELLFEKFDTPVELERYRTLEEIKTDLGPDRAQLLDDAILGCSAKGLNKQARSLYFEVYANLMAENKEVSASLASARFAKIAGMGIKESFGGVSGVANDMRSVGSKYSGTLLRKDNAAFGPEVRTKSSLATMRALLNYKSMRYNKQTNFGMLQMSADRMYPNFLGEVIARMAPELKRLAETNPDQLYKQCGASWLIHDEKASVVEVYRKTLGTCTMDYTTTAGVKCFGAWMMMCPAMNVSLALATTQAYFQTKRATPACAETFRKVAKIIRTK